MTTAEVLLIELDRLGISVSVDRGELVLRGALAKIDNALMEELKHRKADMLAQLIAQADGTALGSGLNDLSDDCRAMIGAAVPGGWDNVEDVYPLSPLQEGILFHHLMAEEEDPYVMLRTYRFANRAEFEAYVDAVRFAIGRHDILRTSFVWQGLDEPLQVVCKSAEMAFEQVWIEDGIDVAQAMHARFRTTRIRLQNAPLMRAFYANDQADGTLVMCLLLQHIIGDHESLAVLDREIAAHRAGAHRQLQAPVPFRAHVARSRAAVDKDDAERFFRDMLGDVTEPTAPFRLARPSGAVYEIVQERCALGEALVTRLRRQTQRLGVSVAAFFHYAWAVALSRVSVTDDIVFGTVLSGRSRVGSAVSQAFGPLINTLPIRVTLDDAPLAAAIKRVHANLATLFEYEHASLSAAHRCSAIEAPSPLFYALFNFRHGADTDADADSERPLGCTLLRGSESTSYPFTLSVDDWGSEISLTLQCDVSVSAAMMLGITSTTVEHILELLECDASAGNAAVSILSPADRQTVLQWSTADSQDLPAGSLYDLFLREAGRRPSAVAIIDGETSVTFEQLVARAEAIARHLASLGIGPSDRVATLLHRSVDLIASQLAVVKCGAAYIPIDPASPQRRVEFVLQDSDAALVLSDISVEIGHALALLCVDVKTIAPIGETRATWEPGAHIDDMQDVYVMYTSGSTGTPKGVVTTHRAVKRLSIACRHIGFSDTDRVAFVSNPAFDASTMDVWASLLSGACIVVVDHDTFSSPASYLALMRRENVSITFLTTAYFNQCVEHDPACFGALKILLTGGEAAKRAAFEQVLTHGKPQRLLHCYGPTESTTYATWHDVEDAGELDVLPIGKPLQHTSVYILDQYGQPVPIGVAGELYIGGVGVARGYLNRPELTAERFVRDPFSAVPEARMYRSGDLGRWLPDGTIEFLGRNDFQVKVRGFRIELGEIESRLVAQPGVREAVVLAREDVPGDKRLIAYYLAEEALSAQSLRTALQQELPDYMVPAAYVHLAQWPLTPSGKLDRNALPAPDGQAYTQRVYEPPQGEVETTLASIWCELLRVEQVGRYDNFFELGGHSLLAVTLMERMRRRGLSADVKSIFSAPTLSDLARLVDGVDREVVVPPNLIPSGCEVITPEMLPLVRLTAAEIGRIVAHVPGGASNVQDIYPLAPLQEGILFHHLMATEGDPYLLSSMFRFDQRSRLDAYLSALQAVIDRHDILRTGIVWEGVSEPVQVVWRDCPLSIEEIELDPSAGGAIEQLQARFDPRTYRIDVSQAPLMRALVAYDASCDKWVLLLLTHHFVIDHTAFETLQDEVYRHILGGAAAFPEPVRFRNFVAQARQGVSREQHETFFRAMLADVDEPTAPFGLSHVRAQGNAVRHAIDDLDAALSARLRTQSRRLGVSVASLCHLAWGLVLARVSGRDDVVFGTVLFGRMQSGEGSDRAMGLFINTLPIRLRIDDVTVEAGVRRTHALLAELLHHEHASLALAQRCSAVVAPSPLFHVLFNYRHFDGTAKENAEESEFRRGMEWITSDERTTYPIALSVNDFGTRLSLTAQTQGAVEPERMIRFAETALLRLVDALEVEPTQPLRAIDALPDAERRLVEAWNDTAAPYPVDSMMHELFEEKAAHMPDAIAVVQDDATLTYGELNAQANRLAHYLRSLGVKPDERVGICVERSPAMLMALLAVLKAGGAYVPLDPNYPADRLAYMLEDSAPVAVLTQRALPVSLQWPANVPVLALDADNAPWQDAPAENPARGTLSPHDLAYVIYTSGSTGKPKGVMVEHRGLCNLATAQLSCFGVTADSRVLQYASFSFDSCVFDILLAWGSGAALHLPKGASGTVVGKELADLIARAGITHASLTPPVLATLLECRGTDRLEVMISSGDVLPHAVAAQAAGQPFRLFNGYGPTENTICTTAFDCVAAADGILPIGRPIQNVRIYILDRHGRPTPVGVPGELYIGGIGVARGYLGRPQLTAERFVRDSFVVDPQAAMYKTGDLGCWLPDGTIDFVGRNDFQVKLRGFRVELGEIESRLAACPGIGEVMVVAREDVPGEKYLATYYRANEAQDVESLRAMLQQELPDYMVPAAYVHMTEWPLTPTGKVDRNALPAPDSSAYALRTYEPPEGEVETALASIWSELLRVEQVGRRDDFFELGGHSLVAVQVVSHVRHAFDVDVPLVDLFAAPKLVDFAQRIEDALFDGVDEAQLQRMISDLDRPE
ncbi:non-ribosomal peptide synthetase [Lysobacter sp. ESA13C]|uniref:non-ribosomal peptide synthetase n=3 Tax=Lysobacter sp. ESA13C TaxID=2862676 RepID=UPI001CC1B393|nr:non-ribosomal peptide synthetase [Lysobacter sp. ESA13C]